jgi:methionyl-tRNA formyltransferase
VHTSLLPAYRGAAPIQWAVARGETVTGVTTMLMDEGLDTGPMLLSRSTPIGPDETAVELGARLAQLGADLVVETLDRLDVIVPTRQDDAAATFAPILKREDGLIDWSMRAKEIADRCRGFQPWPGTWTLIDGARLYVWRAAEEPSGDAATQAPGTVLEARADRLVVACGDGTRLRALELQLEGKRRMPARDFVNGLRLVPGVRLG